MSYFQSFHFSIFSFPEAFFSQNAAFPEFCTLECLISIVFILRFLPSHPFFSANRCFSGFLLSEMFFFNVSIFRFLSSHNLFFAIRCIFGVLRSGTSYFQSFHFSIFSFPEAFFSQNSAFSGLCTLVGLISKILIFRFLASQKLFFLKKVAFWDLGFINVVFPKFLILHF